jgi:hypothetical protein
MMDAPLPHTLWPHVAHGSHERVHTKGEALRVSVAGGCRARRHGDRAAGMQLWTRSGELVVRRTRARGTPRVALLGAAVSLLLLALPGAAAAAGTTSWNAASDFRAYPAQANPAGTWSYLQTAGASRNPLNFTALSVFTQAAFGVPGIDQWAANTGDGNSHLPMVGVNESGHDQTLLNASVTWPAGAMVVHPFTNDVVVRWTSPVASTVTVTGGFSALDRGDPLWYVDHNGVDIAAGDTHTNPKFDGGSSAGLVVQVAVGDTLDFVLAPNPGYLYDLTRADISISAPVVTPTVSSQTQVTCNLDVVANLDTCAAQVGDGESSPENPTGTVNFQIVAGSATKGTFVRSSCTLAPTPLSPNVSSCTVQYKPLDPDFPHIRASYSGDSRLLPSTGDTMFVRGCIQGSLPTRTVDNVYGQPLLPDTPPELEAPSDAGANAPKSLLPCEWLPQTYLAPPIIDKSAGLISDSQLDYDREYVGTNGTHGWCPPGYTWKRVTGPSGPQNSCEPFNPTATPTDSALARLAGRQRNRASKGSKKRYGMMIKLRLPGPGDVTVWAARRSTGRRASRNRCVAPSPRRTSKGRRCTRLTLVKASYTLILPAGTSSLLFDGYMGKQRLAPGRYVLILRPSLQGRIGHPRILTVSIVRHKKSPTKH